MQLSSYIDIVGAVRCILNLIFHRHVAMDAISYISYYIYVMWMGFNASEPIFCSLPKITFCTMLLQFETRSDHILSRTRRGAGTYELQYALCTSTCPHGQHATLVRCSSSLLSNSLSTFHALSSASGFFARFKYVHAGMAPSCRARASASHPSEPMRFPAR